MITTTLDRSRGMGSRAAATVACAGLVLLAGCASNPPSRDSSPVLGGGMNARSTGAPCLITRADLQRALAGRIEPAAIPADLRRFRISRDNQSFVARVGRDVFPGLTPFTRPGEGTLIAFVNHGTFDPAQLPRPGPVAAQPAASKTAPAGTAAHADQSPSWAIYLFSASTHATVLANPLTESTRCVHP